MKLFRSRERVSLNVLDLTPVRIREFEQNRSKADGTVTVLVPKFGVSRFGRWLASLIKTMDNRANLDKVGTFVWTRCDGTKRVKEIALALKGEFGAEVEPAEERVALFLLQMKRARFIVFRETEKSQVQPTSIRT